MSDIRQLLYRFAIRQCKPEELDELRRWAKGNKARTKLLERLSDGSYIGRQLERREFVPVKRPAEEMRRFIVGSRLRSRIKSVAVAAGVAIILGFGAVVYHINSGHGNDTSEVLVAETGKVPGGFDGILPGTVRASLRSGAGKVMQLNATDTAGVVSGQSSGTGVLPQKVDDLCLEVPRGGEFRILLEDSTEVWLNSESRLTYPEVFNQVERRVKVEGEAYFIVKRDESRPFYVDTRDLTVKVYGTSFNVRAYDDDEFVATTLERGAVAITRRGLAGGELMLRPGHQALFDRIDSAVRMKLVDPMVITGWRHGKFVFEDQPLKIIMRDLARWYDFEYEFEDRALENIVFMGSIPRYSNFSAARHILEQSGDIELRLDGEKIIVAARKSHGI